MKTASVSTAKNHLSALLEDVRRGETYIITDHRRPVARLERLELGTAHPDIASLISTGIVSPAAGKADLKAFFRLPLGVAPAADLAAAVDEDREGR